MARLLKQSTAFTFRIGPFVDDTDFKTPETGLSIGQADIQISKNGGAFAQTSEASPTTTHDSDGWYQCPLTATDTNTLGPLTVQIAVSGALPVWEHFVVVPANVYDSLVGGSDALQTDLTQINGVAQRATDLAEIAQYLFANAATLTDVLADNSVLAQLLATDGDISEYSKTTDALQSIRDGVAEIELSVPTTNTASFGQLLAGTETGTYAKTTAQDDDPWVLTDPDGSNPFDGALVFDIPANSSLVRLNARAYFDAAPNRYAHIWANDYTDINSVHDEGATATDANPSVITASEAGLFSGLTLDGLPIYIASGTNVVQGFYTIASNTDDTITLTSNCCSGGAGSNIEYQVIVWEQLTSEATAIQNGNNYAYYEIGLYPRHMSCDGTCAILRFTDTGGAGFSTGYDLKLDLVTVTSQGATGTSCVPAVIAAAVADYLVEAANKPHTIGSIIRAMRLGETTVATADTATSFTLADGPAADNAYVGAMIVVEDGDSAVMVGEARHREARRVTAWTSGRVVTVDRAFSFTPAAGDRVIVWPSYSRQTGDAYGRLGAPAGASVSADMGIRVG